MITEYAPGVGIGGGSCECPNGGFHWAGVIGACPTLACENGLSRSCESSGGQWSYKKVVCGNRKDLVGFDDLYGLDTQTKRLLDLTRQQKTNIDYVK